MLRGTLDDSNPLAALRGNALILCANAWDQAEVWRQMSLCGSQTAPPTSHYPSLHPMMLMLMQRRPCTGSSSVWSWGRSRSGTQNTTPPTLTSCSQTRPSPMMTSLLQPQPQPHAQPGHGYAPLPQGSGTCVVLWCGCDSDLQRQIAQDPNLGLDVLLHQREKVITIFLSGCLRQFEYLSNHIDHEDLWDYLDDAGQTTRVDLDTRFLVC